MRRTLLLALFVLTTLASAEVRVAFFSCYDWYGNLIEFEPGGRFCHVAVNYQNSWLHAHPVRGVEVQNNLSQIKVGKLELILSDESADSLSSDLVEPWIGIPYDRTFKWATNKATYCSKLVGQLLQVPPKIMNFEAEYWKQYKNLPENELGISPDGVYRELVERGYVGIKQAKVSEN